MKILGMLLNFAEQLGLRQPRRTGGLPPRPDMRTTSDPIGLGQRILKIAPKINWSSPAIRAGLSEQMEHLRAPMIGDEPRNGYVDWTEILNSLAPQVRECFIEARYSPEICRRAADMGLSIELLVLSVMALSRVTDDPEVGELVCPSAGGRVRDFPRQDAMFAAFGLQSPPIASLR